MEKTQHNIQEPIIQKHDRVQHAKNIQSFLQKRQNQLVKIFQIRSYKEKQKKLISQKIYQIFLQKNSLKIANLIFKLDKVTSTFLENMIEFAKKDQYKFYWLVDRLTIQYQSQQDLKLCKEILSKVSSFLNQSAIFMNLKGIIKQTININFAFLVDLTVDYTIDNYQFLSIIDFSNLGNLSLEFRVFRLKVCGKIFLPNLKAMALTEHKQQEHRNTFCQLYTMKKDNKQYYKNNNIKIRNSAFFNFNITSDYDLSHLIKANQDLQRIYLYGRQNFRMMGKTIKMIQKKGKLQLGKNMFKRWDPSIDQNELELVKKYTNQF